MPQFTSVTRFEWVGENIWRVGFHWYFSSSPSAHDPSHWSPRILSTKSGNSLFAICKFHEFLQMSLPFLLFAKTLKIYYPTVWQLTLAFIATWQIVLICAHICQRAIGFASWASHGFPSHEILCHSPPCFPRNPRRRHGSWTCWAARQVHHGLLPQHARSTWLGPPSLQRAAGSGWLANLHHVDWVQQGQAWPRTWSTATSSRVLDEVTATRRKSRDTRPRAREKAGSTKLCFCQVNFAKHLEMVFFPTPHIFLRLGKQ